MGNTYKPGFMERGCIAILAGLHALLGLYYASPLYVTESANTASGNSPSLYLFPNEFSVHIYGAVLFASSIAMLFFTFKKGTCPIFLSRVILVNLVLRTYHHIGIMIAVQSLLPPSWLSRMATIMILALVYLKVRLDGKPTR